MPMSRLIAAAACALSSMLSLPTLAQTQVQGAWVRGTVPQQKATGAYMQISSTAGAKLISASSPAAGVVEVHEMKMNGNTMQMRAVPSLDLPAGQAVALKPGGHHFMLLDLRAPLNSGDTVVLNLVVEGRDGKRETLVVKAPVRALGAAAPEHKH